MDRKNILKKVKNVVIKIGTQVLIHENNRVDTSIIEHLGEQIVWLISQGKRVVIVTSGAIGAGIQILGWKKRPEEIEKLQAAASVGQSRLMRLYERIFREEGYNVGQVLLTRDIFEIKERREMAKLTLKTLLDNNIIPIINENDAIAVEEIKFGDNDYLSSLVVHLLNADCLILLTDVNGFYELDPKHNNNIEPVKEIIWNSQQMNKIKQVAKKGSPSLKGVGGMVSKVDAIDKVLRENKICIIANGKKSWILKDIFQKENIGTLFLPGIK
ncbi:MAG: glutamate 5-kinase [Candidatus Omnitrophica bacterium]|jgi:glutamate 5-kinase|nr:glutamate 5-kinase [Candidatus Omnitrophota bacterium]